MSNTKTITELEKEQRELKEQLEALNTRNYEIIRELQQAKLSATIKATVNFGGNHVSLQLERFDVRAVNILQTVEGRFFQNDKNYFPPELLSSVLKQLGDIQVDDKAIFEIVYSGDAEKRIQHYLNAPDYEVELERGDFIITVGPKTNTWDITSGISNLRGGSSEKKYKLQSSEYEGLLKFLESEKLRGKRVAINNEAQKIIDDQKRVANRMKDIAAKKDSKLKFPDLNGQQLKPFQRVDVEFGLAADNWINADQMGLGKSPTSLGYFRMLEAAVKKDIRGLWIVPANLIPNWVKQIYKFTGEYPFILDKVLPAKMDYEDLLLKKPKICLTSYNTMGKMVEDSFERETFPWIMLINASQFDAVFIDEGHYIKDANSSRSKAIRQIQCKYKSVLTGTPIQNRPSELWPILNFLYPERFENQQGFINTYSNGKNGVKNVERLHRILDNIMIRHLKKDVQADLPDINRIPEYYELSTKGKKVYNRALEGVYESIEGNKSINEIIVLIQRLKQISSIDKVQYVIDLADRLVDSHSGDKYDKVLIFSQYTNTVKRIAAELECEYIIGGDKTENMRIVERFQNDPRKKFLSCSSKATQEGFDMTAAGYTITVDLLWNPESHNQLEGRAYGRLNDPHPIDSYYVYGRGTIEEMIQALLMEKSATNKLVIDKDGEEVKNMSVMRELIKQMRETGFMPLK